MPNFRRPTVRSFAAAAGLLLLPIVLVACPSTGAATGQTMHVSIQDNWNGSIGGGPLGVTGTAVEGLEGDLAEGGAGTWRGTLKGSTDRTYKTTVADQTCQSHIVGTQDIDVVGVQGSFANNTNWSLQFTPKTAPAYTSPDTCPGAGGEKANNGIEWLDFNNGGYTSSMTVVLPGKPGGTSTQTAGQGQSKDDPCSVLAPLFGCTWTRTVTVQYGTASGT